jgi:hypothetical protein
MFMRLTVITFALLLAAAPRAAPVRAVFPSRRENCE